VDEMITYSMAIPMKLNQALHAIMNLIILICRVIRQQLI